MVLVLPLNYKFNFAKKKLIVLLQKYDDKNLRYVSKWTDFDIERGDVILSRTNHIRVIFRADGNYGGNGFLASFQAGIFCIILDGIFNAMKCYSYQ